MIKRIALITALFSVFTINTVWAEDETVQSPECNPEILSCETITPTPTLTPTPTSPVTQWCSDKKCYILVDQKYYLLDEEQGYYQDYLNEVKTQIIQENIQPITDEIEEVYANIDELKRELGAQVEDKKSVVSKDGLLYGIIALLSVLTLIFGIKAFKNKK